jgi:ABC-2 type transport system permease protein
MITYFKYELLRTVRNRQNFIFTLLFPLVFYFLIAAPNKNDHNFSNVAGLWAPQYYMISLLGFGGLIAATSSGARIAAERQVGWNRQLRITPLSARTYLTAKVAISYLLVISSIALLYVLGIGMGVRLGAAEWVVMTLLVLLSLVPFAALGIAIGHLVRDDAIGPIMGGGTSILAFLGGAWFPLTGSSWFVQLCKLLPSFWVVQAGHVGLGGSKNPWGVQGWVVIAFWTVALSGFAVWAYRRDTKRA